MKDLKAHFYKKMYIADSKISGKGLFAGESIKAGEIILSFGGMLAVLEDRYFGKYLQSTFAGIADGIIICEEADAEKDFSDYINHSCQPNIGMDDCITMVSIHEIKKDEELVCDYSFWEADEDWIMKYPCNCGSKKCRKAISGKDWRKVQINDPYFSFYAPFIQRRIINNERES